MSSGSAIAAIANLFQTTMITEERSASSVKEDQARYLVVLSVCTRTKKFIEYGVEKTDLEHGKQLLAGLGADPIVVGDSPTRAEQFNLLCESIALLSCCPGGVEAFGLRFETSVPALLMPKTFELTYKRSKRYRQAQQDAVQAGQELIQSWGDDFPMQGYAKIGTCLHNFLRENHRDIGVEDRVEITGEVQNVLFVPLLPEYERIYGQEAVRTCLGRLYE